MEPKWKSRIWVKWIQYTWLSKQQKTTFLKLRSLKSYPLHSQYERSWRHRVQNKGDKTYVQKNKITSLPTSFYQLDAPLKNDDLLLTLNPEMLHVSRRIWLIMKKLLLIGLHSFLQSCYVIGWNVKARKSCASWVVAREANKVFKTMEAFGDNWNFSNWRPLVFRCRSI